MLVRYQHSHSSIRRRLRRATDTCTSAYPSYLGSDGVGTLLWAGVEVMVKQQTWFVDVEAVVGIQARLQALHAAEHHQRVAASKYIRSYEPLARTQVVDTEMRKTMYM